MTTPILSKLIAAGLSAALGGAGLFAVAPDAPAPAAPTSAVASFHSAPETDPGMANLLSRVDPSVLADPEVAAALRDPRVVSVLSDPEVQRALEGIDPAVLTRPAVLEAIAVRQVTPEALADPVVQANLPAILSALPTLRAAYERAETGATPVEPAPTVAVLPSTPEPAPVVTVSPPAPEPVHAPAPIAAELPAEALPVLIAAGTELIDAPELEALPPTVVPSLVATATELAPALDGGEVDAEAVVTAALPAVLDLANALLASERSARESAHERRAAAQERREARADRRAARAERTDTNRTNANRTDANRADDAPRANLLGELLGLGLQVAVNSGR